MSEWIPCKERMPKEGEEVLITINGGQIFIGKYIKEFFLLNQTVGIFKVDNPTKFLLPTVVKAWMPLPDPYMEDEIFKEQANKTKLPKQYEDKIIQKFTEVK